jgi:hypothetical protein
MNGCANGAFLFASFRVVLFDSGATNLLSFWADSK